MSTFFELFVFLVATVETAPNLQSNIDSVFQTPEFVFAEVNLLKYYRSVTLTDTVKFLVDRLKTIKLKSDKVFILTSKKTQTRAT